MKRSNLYLLDASIYIFRYYFSLPDNWQSVCGRPTETVYGYLSFLLRVLQEQQPVYIAAAYDESLESCFRNDIYPEYKANRALPDEALAFQLAACAEGADLLGVPGYSSNHYEADDIIGSLARGWRGNKYAQVAILSRDKDLGQLLEEGDCLWDYGYSDPQTPGDMQKRLGVITSQIPDYLALVGDSVDNIPGVPGIGKKTATVLLSMYPCIESILEAGGKLAGVPVRGAAKLPATLAAHKEQLRISKQLATICCEVPFEHRRRQTEAAVTRQPVDTDGFAAFAREMGLGNRLIARAGKLD